MSLLSDKHPLALVLITTAMISLLLSIVQIWIDPVINQDAILYLQAAKYIQAGDWVSAGQLYNWPLFSFLIASLASVTQLPVDLAGFLLNSIFVAITCMAFVLIIFELGGSDKRSLWLAALIILCYASLNEDRNLIIRDHGYWAFFSLSTLFFFRLCTQIRLSTALLFVACTLLASLFRIEGVLFLLAMPLMVYVSKVNLQQASARSLAIKTMLLITCLSICIFGALWLSQQGVEGFNKTTQLTNVIELAKASVFDTGSSTSAISKTKQFLIELRPTSHYSKDYALSVLILTIILILFTEIAKTLTPIYLAGVLTWFYLKVGFPHQQLKRPWALLLLLNVLILALFTASHFFLAGRYPVALSLILMLPLPFLIAQLYEAYKTGALNPRSRRLSQCVFALFVLFSLDGMVSFGASKVYLKEAGQWLAQNTNPAIDKIYYDNAQVKFYSGTEIRTRQHDTDVQTTLAKLEKQQLASYDYLAINMKHRQSDAEQQLIKALNTSPIQTFTNERQDKVLIFQPPKRQL